MIIVNVTTEPPPGPEEPPPPPPPVIPEYGFSLELITPTKIWNLATGPVFALSGASGFGSPDMEHWWRAPSSINGSVYQGHRVPQRELALPVEIRGRDADEWLATDREFWGSLDPHELAYIRLTMPDATSRFLPVHVNQGGDPELPIDPMLIFQSIYELDFTAGDPFWHGDRITAIYDTTTAQNLFPGPPFAINSTTTIETSRVTNPGDEPAWPQWVIQGPYISASVGVGDSLVTLGTAIGSTDQRIIDMDPNVRSIRDENGGDRWLEATVAEFAAIPSGSNVELTLAVSGGTSETHIELIFDSRYRRAW